jgi:two-component system KDP operon response regulator KdpE
MTDSGPRVLVVDDERAIRHFLQASLEANGCLVYEAASGEEALREVAGVRPDVVILDLGLPDLEGVEVIRRLRAWSEVPVIVLSVRDKIEALETGADDYLTKPFSVGELVARLRAALRRATRTGPELVFTVDALEVDIGRRRVRLNGEEVALTPTEYDLLRVFVQYAGRVLTHRHLLRQVWGASYEPETHLLRVNVSNLRRKLEPDPMRPHYILTEPGVGYRLRGDS